MTIITHTEIQLYISPTYPGLSSTNKCLAFIVQFAVLLSQPDHEIWPFYCRPHARHIYHVGISMINYHMPAGLS